MRASPLQRIAGRRGLEVPLDPPRRPARAKVEDLVRLALRGLERMYDPAREVLFTRSFEGGPERVDHLGARYTAMASIGLADAIAAGFETPLDPRRLASSALERGPEDEIDHLAACLWADVASGGDLAGRLFPRLIDLVRDDGRTGRAVGRVLAWALTALALHRERADGAERVRLDEAARHLADIAMRGCWREGSGLFAHRSTGPDISRSQTLFSTQVYWVYALSAYGRAVGDGEAARVAGRCADALIALRDPFGGWPWRYDARTGAVVERYPVYSVHQDAMAPMSLFRLAEADDRDVDDLALESLGWLWRNDLSEEMVDANRAVIYRAIRRVPPIDRAFVSARWLPAALRSGSPWGSRPWFLGIDATCRPYHLGWILHAWAGRLAGLRGD